MPQVKLILPKIITKDDNRREIKLEASSLKDVVDYLIANRPDLRSKILDSNGELKNVFNFYVNGKNAMLLKGLSTPLKDGDEISVIPSVIGG